MGSPTPRAAASPVACWSVPEVPLMESITAAIALRSWAMPAIAAWTAACCSSMTANIARVCPGHPSCLPGVEPGVSLALRIVVSSLQGVLLVFEVAADWREHAAAHLYAVLQEAQSPAAAQLDRARCDFIAELHQNSSSVSVSRRCCPSASSFSRAA